MTQRREHFGVSSPTMTISPELVNKVEAKLTDFCEKLYEIPNSVCQQNGIGSFW